MSTTALPRRIAVRANGWDFAQLLLNLLTVAAMAALMWAALVYAKPATNLAGAEQTAQRIFYLHMGCNIGALAAFLMSLIGSIVYLITRNLDWDRVTQASIEVGTICGIGTTLTGAIWAKPTWNTYWTWDGHDHLADLCGLSALPQWHRQSSDSGALWQHLCHVCLSDGAHDLLQCALVSHHPSRGLQWQ